MRIRLKWHKQLERDVSKAPLHRASGAMIDIALLLLHDIVYQNPKNHGSEALFVPSTVAVSVCSILRAVADRDVSAEPANYPGPLSPCKPSDLP